MNAYKVTTVDGKGKRYTAIVEAQGIGSAMRVAVNLWSCRGVETIATSARPV